MGPGQQVVDEDGVVRIGSVVFALIRPGSGHEQAFNHWYERDHYYTAGVAAPGVFSAGRFIESGTAVHLALYFVLPGHDDARVSFATEQVEHARSEDRMFTEREHLHTWSYTVDDTWRANPRGVPPALALDHRYPAISVAMCAPEVEVAVIAEALAADVVVILRPVAQIMPSTWDREIQLAGCRAVVAFHADPPAADPFVGLPGVVWSAGFLPMVFGTDTHIVG